MAHAIRTKDTVLIQEGEATVKVRRPMLPHPRTNFGTFRTMQRVHFVCQRDETADVRVSYRVFQDEGMLRDLERRAGENASGKAQRGPAVAYAGHKATVDLSGAMRLVRIAADSKGGSTSDGPLTAKVRVLDKLEPYMPRCRHCGRPGDEHEFVESAYADYMGRPQSVWLCVPTPDGCQVCAAAKGVMCDSGCPNRDERGGTATWKAI